MPTDRYFHTSSHTKGPWRASRHAGCKDIGPKRGRHRQAQHDVLATTTGGMQTNDGAREDMANAALMAAAPQMWALLVKVSDIECSETTDDVGCGECEVCEAWALLQEIERAAATPKSHLFF